MTGPTREFRFAGLFVNMVFQLVKLGRLGSPMRDDSGRTIKTLAGSSMSSVIMDSITISPDSQ